jgi:hypothetical protein
MVPTAGQTLGNNVANTLPLSTSGLYKMESAGNLPLNVRLGGLRDRAQPPVNHANLIWWQSQVFMKSKGDLGSNIQNRRDCSPVLGYNTNLAARKPSPTGHGFDLLPELVLP